MFCKNCGLENLNSAKFCKSCGNQIGSNQSVKSTSTKMSRFSKNKKMIALAIVMVIAGASWLGFYQYEQKKIADELKELTAREAFITQERDKNLDPDYLIGLAKDLQNYISQIDQVKEDSATEAQVSNFLDMAEEYDKKFGTLMGYYYAHAKEDSLGSDAKDEDFVLILAASQEIDHLCTDIKNSNERNPFDNFAKISSAQAKILGERFVSVEEDFCGTFARTVGRISVTPNLEGISNDTSTFSLAVDGERKGSITITGAADKIDAWGAKIENENHS